MQLRAWVAVMVLVLASTPALADELPLRLRVGAGGMVANGPWRAAPAVDLSASIGPQSWPVALVAGFNGWTLPGRGGASGTEAALSLGVGVRHQIGRDWAWSLAASPALLWVDRAVGDTSVEPGLLLSPALELGTRRRTLNFSFGVQGLWVPGGLRTGATAGVVYAFH